MSAPFLIWTLRRTGGTTLTSLLTALSEHPGTQHEPFNPERRFGAVTQQWHETGDRQALRHGIEAALAPRPVVKHCFEIMPAALNRALLEVATGLGYRHVILDRRAEVDRVLSLELAKITGAWGSEAAQKIYAEIDAGEAQLAPLDVAEAVTHLRYCRKRRDQIRTLMAEMGQNPHVVYFEDVYGDPAAGPARVGAILDFLDIDPADHADYATRLEEALLHRGQNSARVMSAVPNIDAARAALEKAQSGQTPVFAAS